MSEEPTDIKGERRLSKKAAPFLPPGEGSEANTNTNKDSGDTNSGTSLEKRGRAHNTERSFETNVTETEKGDLSKTATSGFSVGHTNIQADTHRAPAETHRLPTETHRVPAETHRVPAETHRAPADSHRAQPSNALESHSYTQHEQEQHDTKAGMTQTAETLKPAQTQKPPKAASPKSRESASPVHKNAPESTALSRLQAPATRVLPGAVSPSNTTAQRDFKDVSEFKPDLSKPPVRKEDPCAVPISRTESTYSLVEDDDAKSDGSTDLQFRKKDFNRSRTQSFQSVLSSASLKSLKQQFTAPNHPQLHRNPSTVSQNHTKNFQSFIQAPVLSSVTNLRTSDIEIGQRMPFDHRPSERGLDSDSTSLLADAASLNPTVSQAETIASTEAEDIYKEETTLQQQKLTLNALKKLSLSLAPIIRSDEDDDDGSSRQLTTKSLNRSRQESRVDLQKPLAKMSEKVPKPYQPAEVDLSSFSSLTRQSKHIGEALENHEPVLAERPQNQRSADSEATIIQIPEERSRTVSDRNETQGHEKVNENQDVPQEQPTRKATQHQTQKQNTQEQPTQTTQQQAAQPQRAASRQMQNKFEPPRANSSQKPRSFPRPTMQMHTMNGMSSLGSEVKSEMTKKPSSVKMPEKRLQQINGFRSPMYVPAVLRRTNDESLEYNQSETDGYFDQRNSGENLGGSSSNSVKSFDSGYSAESVGSPAQKMSAPYTLNRRQYEYILRAAPTRKHWQRDDTVFACGNKQCQKKFNFFERRHHCRKCGGIFCKEHTSHYLYINHLAQFTTGGRGTLSRVCDGCIEEYNEFMKLEFGVTLHAPAPRDSLPERSAQKIDYRKEILSAKVKLDRDDKKVGEQLVGSVPANWSWSSF